MRPTRTTSPRAKRGFALIVTISMMILLVVVAIGLLSLSTIELRAARQHIAMAEAKANARLGLQLAIGRLQRTLGPDARASANASILDQDPSTLDIDGVRHPHWLGAYPALNPDSPDDGLVSPDSLRAWSLNSVQWLASSATGANPDPTVDLGADAVTLAQFIKDASVTIPDNPGINGLSPDQINKARAGLVKVHGNSGRYAWWVADESMKARVDTLASPDGSGVLDGSAVDSEAQNRSNYEIVQGTDFSEQLPGYKDSTENLLKLITPNQLDLLGRESSDSSWANWSKLNQDKFTPYSASLPVDVANGRLKMDLTAYLEGSYAGLDKQSMIDPRFSISAKTPSFDLLKQWAKLVDDNKDPQQVTARDNNSSTARHGLHPLITQAAVAMQQSYKILSPTTVRPVFMLQPQIQIWNPHNVPLAAQDYIVQIGYQFRWWLQVKGTRNTDVIKFPQSTNPEMRSWMKYHGQSPLPPHIPADNETIDYQNNKRFFTFVIKDQVFEPGESLIFYAKPPSSGPISGVPYNMADNADTNILNNFSSDEDLNLLMNEGNLDEFFYFIHPMVGTASANTKPKLRNQIRAESNFRSNEEDVGISDREDLEMHANLYAFKDDKPTLVHALKKPQKNERFGNWQRPTYPLNRYQNGEIFASDTYDYKSALINLGSSMLASNFDIFQGGSNLNLPPKAGQPHSVLNQWNIRNPEGFSASSAWGKNVNASSWLNTFSFRDAITFKNTWEATDNMYGNLSTDRLGGWHLSQVQGMVYPFFDYPTGDYGPLSIGSFQHANLSVYSWQPTYAFGNSQAPPRFDRSGYQSAGQPDLYDLSYLLNASTWDSYYLSTIPQDGVTLKEGMRLPNSRQHLAGGTGPLKAPDLTNTSGFTLSAANVLIHGGFNVNSTSHGSWKAFLSGAMGQRVETLHSNTESNSETAAAMGRFLAPLLEEPESVADDRDSTRFSDANSWAATRTLSAGEIDTLASRIVEEVKRRGPFLSLAGFVNRRLKPASDVTDDERVYQEVLGTLQAAINKATMEDQKINNHYYANGGTGSSIMSIKPAQDWGGGSGLGFDVPQTSQEAMFGYPASKIESRGGLIHSYTPNFLSQADVLAKIGPSIAVRGDTYVIRSYGDSIHSKTGAIAARAWCEAVVQRSAEPVAWDGSSDKLVQPQAPDETGFGRRFKLIGFRYLKQEDIMPFSDDSAVSN